MVSTKRCELCDIGLEFEGDGKLLRFTAHTPELCRVGTLERIRNLTSALKTQGEVFKDAADKYRRRVDALLADAGLPTLAERARDAEVIARTLATAPGPARDRGEP